MKCRYTFRLVSEAALSTSLYFKKSQTAVTLVSEKDRFVAIVIEQPNVSFGAYPTLTPPSAVSIASINLPTDPLLPFILQEMRTIRGALALWNVYDIDIEHPEIEWIPETEPEHKATDVFGFSMNQAQRGTETPRLTPLDQLIRPILSCESLCSFEIPLEFCRRGAEDLRARHFIEAIYDFYFVLEYLFADGQFTKHGTSAAMLASPELSRIIKNAQQTPLPMMGRKPSDLAAFTAKYQGKTIAQVINTILEVRGLLHHQSLTRKINWNPNTPDAFNVDACFLYNVAHSAVLNLVTGRLFESEEVARFISTEVYTQQGQKITWTPMPDLPETA